MRATPANVHDVTEAHRLSKKRRVAGMGGISGYGWMSREKVGESGVERWIRRWLP